MGYYGSWLFAFLRVFGIKTAGRQGPNRPWSLTVALQRLCWLQGFLQVGIIKQNWNYMVQKNPELEKVMPAPPRVCLKKLRDMLVRAKLPPPAMQKNVRTKQGFRRCMNSRCQVCPYTVSTPTHTSLHRKKTWSIQTAVDCNTSHCVYAVLPVAQWLGRWCTSLVAQVQFQTCLVHSQLLQVET